VVPGARDVISQLLHVTWYRYRATFARQLPAYLTVVLLIGLLGGVAMASVAGARRTQSSNPVFLASTNASTLTMAVYRRSEPWVVARRQTLRLRSRTARQPFPGAESRCSRYA
jgi:hypothetical protein